MHITKRSSVLSVQTTSVILAFLHWLALKLTDDTKHLHIYQVSFQGWGLQVTENPTKTDPGQEKGKRKRKIYDSYKFREGSGTQASVD